MQMIMDWEVTQSTVTSVMGSQVKMDASNLEQGEYYEYNVKLTEYKANYLSGKLRTDYISNELDDQFPAENPVVDWPHLGIRTYVPFVRSDINELVCLIGQLIQLLETNLE
jgi:hypothetical protein